MSQDVLTRVVVFPPIYGPSVKCAGFKSLGKQGYLIRNLFIAQTKKTNFLNVFLSVEKTLRKEFQSYESAPDSQALKKSKARKQMRISC